MARPKKTEAEKLDSKIMIRVTKAEKEFIEAQADERGLTVSDWIRILMKRIPKERLSKLQIVDTRTPAAIMSLSGNLKNLYNEYGRTGNFFADKTYAMLDTAHETMLSIKRAYDAFYERMMNDDR